jgi:hypothetical protein
VRFVNASNNEAEYEAVLHGIRMAKACGATHVKIHGDLNLIEQQVMKECDATCPNMVAYRAMHDKLKGTFEGCKVSHIGRERNEDVDTLANIGSKCLPIPQGDFFEEIFEHSIKLKPKLDKPALATRSGASGAGQQADVQQDKGLDEPKFTSQIAQVMLIEPIWTKPYLAYLLSGKKPDDIVHQR